MQRIEVELFTDGSNNAVVRMPGRSFPGVVVQGDTLSILWSHAQEAMASLRAGAGVGVGVGDQYLDDLEILVDDLDAMLRRYEGALEQAGIPRPYHLPSRP